MKTLSFYIIPSIDLVVPTNMPAVVILISNLVVACIIIKRKSQTSSSLREKQIIMMLLLSGSAFLVLNLPFSIVRAVYEFQTSFNLENSPLYRLDNLDFLNFTMFVDLFYNIYLHFCTPLNYSINFYLYALSHGFRQELYGTFTCLHKYQTNT